MSTSCSELIETLTNLVKSSEDLLSVMEDDESRQAIWSDEIESLYAAANYARGVLLADGHPVE